MASEKVISIHGLGLGVHSGPSGMLQHSGSRTFPHRTSSLPQYTGAMSEAAVVMRSQSGFIATGGSKELPTGSKLF